MSQPKVIVLILSYNGKELLEESVSSYLANDYPNFEVVVIDNGSNDGTSEYVKKEFPEVTLLRIDNNRGYSGGFNYGLKYAFDKKEADYVLITNNDVKADKKVITELVKVARKDDKIGFVTGKVYYYDKPNILQTVGKYSDPVTWKGGKIGNKVEDKGQFEHIKERDFCDDIFWLVNSELYYKTGGYDTNFFLQAEDYDWQARAKQLEYKIMYTPHAKIWHKDSYTIGSRSALKAYYDARNPMLVILKHKSADFFRKYFWVHFLKHVFKGSFKIIIKNFEVKKAYKVWAGFLSGVLWGVNNRKFTLEHFIKIRQ